MFAPPTEPLAGPSLEQAAKDGEGGRSILAGWDKGFFLRSADKAFDLRITGYEFLPGLGEIFAFERERPRLGTGAHE